MTAGQAIAQADALRPNQYSTQQKLSWLRRLDGQIRQELLETHVVPGEDEAAAAAESGLPLTYDLDSQLLAPFPYAEELYSAYLFCQIDLHNAEIQKYNQSITLLSAAWRQLADWLNRRRLPRGAAGWKF